MQRTVNRILALVLAVVLFVPVVSPALTQPVAAMEYKGSAAYMSGKYYRALTEVNLTGNPRTDIVNIARSQLGYQEGGSSNQLSGEVYGGVNYTEYGRWYGVQNMWCAMFASWCAEQAGISTDLIPKHAYTPDGLRWFQKRGLAYSRAKVAAGEYTPQPGDLIYFKSSRNKNPTNHVGIVTGYADGVVYSIEGNTSSASISTNGGAVVEKSYPITNTYIVYICCPDYEGTGPRVADTPVASNKTNTAVKQPDYLAMLRKAIYAMETGSKDSYDSITTSYGGVIAIGGGQWYGMEAKALLQRIRNTDKSAFAKLDTAGIGADLEEADWSRYQISVDSEKAECIRRILDSTTGRKVQDAVMNETLRQYQKEAAALGVKSTDAQWLYAGLRHLLGARAVKHLLEQVEGGYTVENICGVLDTTDDVSMGAGANMICRALKV